jgi:formate dehydrogenase beta subunit
VPKKTVETPFPGGYLLLDLLRSGKDGHGAVACGPDTVIIGGEGLAGEVLTQARSKGAKTVTFIFRNQPDPATVKALEEAGAHVMSAAVTRLSGDGESLTGVEINNTATGENHSTAGADIDFFSGSFSRTGLHPTGRRR